MFELSGKSKSHLADVHPELVRLVKRVIGKTRIDFGVSEGVRDYARQVKLYHGRKTTTLHSQHFINDHTGYGHAIDIFAYMNGKAQWNSKYYGPIVQTFLTEAVALGIQIQCGHLWKEFQDSPHIQLNPRFY